jgi:hypothetical protein
MLLHPANKIEQGPALLLGPLPPAILQWPKTASSGRRLMVVKRGGSYAFLQSVWFNSLFIQPHPS